MASMLPTRTVRTFACSACRTFVCPSTVGSASLLSRRALSTSTEQTPVDNADKPRWSYTPPRAKAPFSLRLNNKREYPVNSNPEVLDQFYIRMLGNDGDKLLSEEIKWLAVTHKSFDQGRRGFNDRLAFLGKRIVQLQASLALVQNPGNTKTTATPDSFHRVPFSHPALDGLNNLSPETKDFLTNKLKLAELARKYEMEKVLRWSPRRPGNLASSGIDLVLAHTLYAVVGAISVEKGGHVSNKVARERILEPLGFNVTA
ncbi:RNase III domain protein [Aspergillus coremiiformis]|uniref:RNase III domain protein n=1 Tax=Aspergillus coremiiformis TaxID=138285 RepID=A0A5N6Z012_9EURO|nr:RNase III domain protein [Aspergillus coremiiformis]